MKIHVVRLIGTQQSARRGGQAEYGLATNDLDLAGDGGGVLTQGLVVRVIGNVVGEIMGESDTQRPDKE